MRNTYSLYITISFELPDVSAPFNKLTEVKNHGYNYAPTSDILSKYPKNIKDITAH